MRDNWTATAGIVLSAFGIGLVLGWGLPVGLAAVFAVAVAAFVWMKHAEAEL